MPSRDAQKIRTVPADEDERAFRPGSGVAGSVPQLVPATAERTPTTPQHAHYLDSLTKRRDPLPSRGPWHPEGCGLIVGTTSPQAQYDPATRQCVQRGCHLGHHGWMTVRIGEHQRNRDELLSGPGERGQSGPAFRARNTQNVVERSPIVSKTLAFLPYSLQL